MCVCIYICFSRFTILYFKANVRCFLLLIYKWSNPLITEFLCGVFTGMHDAAVFQRLLKKLLYLYIKKFFNIEMRKNSILL